MKKIAILFNVVLIFALALLTLDIWKSVLISVAAGYLNLMPTHLK